MTKHSSPSVVYPVEQSSIQAPVLLGVWLLGFLSSVHWIYSDQTVGWRFALAFSSSLIAGISLHRYLRTPVVGELSWDGCDWRWKRSPAENIGIDQSVFPIADLQHALVLLMTDQAGSRYWLFAKRSTLPERWLEFRRAVFSPVKPAMTPMQTDTDRDADLMNEPVSRHALVRNPMGIDA